MKKITSQSHEFSLFYEALSSDLSPGATTTVTDQNLVHRLTRVLRLKQGEQCVFFNRERHVVARIAHIGRKSIEVHVISAAPNTQYEPKITFLLPILKRDALAHAVYYLVEAGVNTIYLVQTAKVQRAWGGKKEQERLNRMCIAAAEQSKHFAFPEIKEPLSVGDALRGIPSDTFCFYGDPKGKHFRDIKTDTMPKPYVLTCGPEGDFTSEEKAQLRQVSFQPLRLTPTILRAETAAFCLSSLFRTVFS